MKSVIILLASMLLLLPGTKSVYDYTMKDIDGKDVKLSSYSGKVLIMINVASRCGNTPQYTDIEAFYKKYKDRGVVVLGFPSNDFMGQEPGTEAEIKAFCSAKYNVSFPMFSKIDVKGSSMAPLYAYLTQKSENGNVDSKVSWNFQKFLVDKNGHVVKSFSPSTSVWDPEFVKSVELLLN
jgi:glutathione peroxidase